MDCVCELVALAGGLAEDLPLDCPAAEPDRDSSGDAEPLASVHASSAASSAASFPRSKWTEVLLRPWLLSTPGWDDDRFNAPADLCLLTSACDRLRLRETCDEFFFSDVVEAWREESFGSDPLRFIGGLSGLVAVESERRWPFALA